jgi:uroporphyrinogen-III decarboxylase
MGGVVMDFKERILTAMNHEEPDQVPVMGLIMDPATVNQIKGKKPIDFVGMLKKPILKHVIRGVLNTNWYWTRMYTGNFADAVEGALKLGFDANWTICTLMKLNKDSEASLGMAFHDAFGRVWEVDADDDGNMMINYSRALCPTEEEWEAWVEKKAPLFETSVKNVRNFHKKLAAKYGDRIMPMGYAAPGVFENSWQPIGFVNFTRFVYQKPEFVKRVIDFHTDLYIKHLEAVMECGIEVVLGGDDLGQKTGPLMRPELVDKLYGDSYRRISELVHKQNKKLVWHCCGNIYAFLDYFVDWGFDGIITMEPTAGMDLGKVREQIGHKLVLIGNLDVSYLMVQGTQQEVEDAVKKAIADAAKGGGYILSTSHSHPDVDATRLKWMVDAAHKYGKYPISI